MNPSFKVGLVVVSTTLVAACAGDDDGGGGGGRFGELEGIYQVTSHTENVDGCDAPGDSVIASPAPMYASVAYSLLGYPGLVVVECDSVADCQTTAQETRDNPFSALFGGFSFDAISDGAATGTLSSGFSSGDGPCEARVTTQTMTTAEDGSFTIERRTVIVPNTPLDAEGTCDLEAAQDLAEGQPCNELETIHGDLVEPL